MARHDNMAAPMKLAFAPARLMKRWMPRTLYARTLMILVTPVILAQLMASFVFFDRHWSTMTTRLSYALAGDVGFIVELVEADNSPARLRRLNDRVLRHMDVTLSYQAQQKLPTIPPRKDISPLRNRLEAALRDRLSRPFQVRMRAMPEQIAIDVELKTGLLTILSPERRIYTPTTIIFMSWMLGSSIVLSLIAILFMRNQIRPIRRLAVAAKAFGKGRDVVGFKPEGATEVRQAATALLMMRGRLRRQVTQRTAMLAGISHDLRTPLTRMKLQLTMMPETPEREELLSDVEEMVAMLNAYLAFVRGEAGEPASEVDITELIADVIMAARKLNANIDYASPTPIRIIIRPHAIRRCLANLINNAARFASHIMVSVVEQERQLLIMIDDNGEGIPPEQREDVFRPFVRLDEARSVASGNHSGSVGLGLTIARDIARLHGGDVRLETSPLGGLRAIVRLPR